MSNFEEIYSEAEKALDFLKSEYSFIVSDRRIEDPNTSQYAGGRTEFIDGSAGGKGRQRFIILSTAPFRLEMDLDIGFREKDNEEFYTIYELHRLENGGQFPARQHNLYDAIKDSQQLYAEFEILANVLKQCGGRFFANDKSLWDDLRKQRASVAQANQEIQMHLDAEKAFKEKNWQKVIDILQTNEATLGKLDRSRLDYAIKQLG